MNETQKDKMFRNSNKMKSLLNTVGELVGMAPAVG